LIFIVFFIPVAIYLLVLGTINRRGRPLVVSGAWDFLGILFAASGFLLFGGPAILSSLHERWRLFWLWGRTGPLREGGAAVLDVWLVVACLYFAGVVFGAFALLRRQRALTCIYNVEPAEVEYLLGAVCEELGLEPIRSGNLYVFGLSLGASSGAGARGIQAPHHLPAARPSQPGLAVEGGVLPAVELAGQTAILELETFSALCHVTLRWDPYDSPLRTVVEADLERRLAGARAPDHETGPWLTLAGIFVLGASILAAIGLVLRGLFSR
jgi:hypothetical protein